MPVLSGADIYFDRKMTEKEFIQRDSITGKKGKNPLAKRKLSEHELDEIFGEWEEE